MSRSESVSLVSRLFGLFLLAEALMELTYLPGRIFYLAHTLDGPSVASTADYWSTLSFGSKDAIISAVFLGLRIVGFLLASGVFLRCGPRVRSLLMPKQVDETAIEASES